MAEIFVGEARLPKSFTRYAAQFSLLELDCEPGSIPSKARLRACSEQAPEGFVFSLVVPSRVAALEISGSDSADPVWKAARAAAQLLRAGWWVVRTPAEIRPTRRVKEQLRELFVQLGEGGASVAWEPRGVWDDEDAAETAATFGAHLVQDIARVEPLGSGTLYARLLGLGRGAKLSLSAADRVIERVRAHERAFIVVEGRGARELQQLLAAETGEPLGSEAEPSVP